MRSIAGPPRARGPARERSPLLLPSKLQLSSAERHRSPARVKEGFRSLCESTIEMKSPRATFVVGFPWQNAVRNPARRALRGNHSDKR
jgi:hypothetical protein